MANEPKYQRIPGYTRKVDGKKQTVREHVRPNPCPAKPKKSGR